MKFKFRADPEDLLMFIMFAIFLLYIVAIGVVNLSTFAQEGHLYGLNPFPAFLPKYLASTIVLYLLALGGLFISVSSLFFEREKGFGITTDKKDKGYSRWAKDKEIQEELEEVAIRQPNSKKAGIPLILNKEKMWVDDSEFHSLVIGATGSGKTQAVIFPQVHSLCKAKESMIITDPKGEIYEETANMLRARGYQILLLNFRDPQNGNAWNPMSLPYKIYKSGNQDKAIELLDDLALNILYDDSNKNADPFWEKTSADYFSGVALGLFEDAKEDEININSISLATTVGEEKFGGSTYIKEYFAGKDPASAASINASSTIMAPNETKASILSVFKQKVKLFASRDNLSEMLSHSDIDLESIGERPTAVFIVIQDEKKTYHSLVTILLKQIYETLISVAQRHGGKLPVRTNFLLDEFANMPPLKDVTTMITAARSRRIRFTMIIQNFAQLDSVYGKEDAETIRGNCGNIVYLITTELKALEEISKMCGEVKSKKDDKTASTPLVTVSDLQRMKQFEVIILRMRKQPFKTKLTPNFQLDWGRKYPKAKYPRRPKQPVHTFDIKEFVKNQKKKKLLEMMNAADRGEAPSGLPSSVSGGAELGRIKPEKMPVAMERPTRPTTERPEPRIPDFLTRREESKELDADIFGSTSAKPSFEDILNSRNEELDRKPKPTIKPPLPNIEEELSKPIFVEDDKKTISEPKKEEEDDDLGFDVDELVKKIDAKIAELEAEERKKEAEEKAKKLEEEEKEPKIVSSTPVNSINNVLESTPEEKLTNQISSLENRIPRLDQTPVVEKQQLPKIDLDLNKDIDDDDDFFDDFFDN